MSGELDWQTTVRLSREIRDLLGDQANADPRAKGKSGTMARILIEEGLLRSEDPDTAKARATRARIQRRKRLEEIELLRQDYFDLQVDPNPEAEKIVQERAMELGMKWPPDEYSERDLSTVMLRLRRLEGDGSTDSITLRALHNSLRRHYTQGRLLDYLNELERRHKVQMVGERPTRITILA